MSDSRPTSPFRFALVVDSAGIRAWQADCIRSLVASGEGVPCRLLELEGREPSPEGGSLLSRLYESRWVRPRSEAMRPRSTPEELADVPATRGSALPGADGRAALSPEILRVLEAEEPDFVLWLGAGTPAGEVLDAARYGLWAFVDEAGLVGQGAGCGFWGVADGRAVNTIALARLESPDAAPRTLCRATLRTEATCRRNRDSLLGAVEDWCVGACRALRLGLSAGPDTEGGPDAPVTGRREPSTPDFVRYLGRKLRNLVDVVLDRFRIEVWNLGVVEAPVEDLVRTGRIEGARWHEAPPPLRFYADPFVLPGDASATVFFEDMDYEAGKGRIALTRFDERVGGSEPPCLIEQPCHMSYPYVFAYDGQTYCIPETHQAREVQLYRALEFPGRWTRVGTLLEDFPAIDATVVEHAGRWWLFCTDGDGGSLDRLHVWHAENPLGPWIPHHLNPVKRNIQSSRPAGRPFILDGALHRPAQDCSRTYGGAVTINRIVELGPMTFEEKTVAVIEPHRAGPYPDGLHTICPMGGRTVIDGKKHRLSLSAGRITRRVLDVQREQERIRAEAGRGARNGRSR